MEAETVEDRSLLSLHIALEPCRPRALSPLLHVAPGPSMSRQVHCRLCSISA